MSEKASFSSESYYFENFGNPSKVLKFGLLPLKNKPNFKVIMSPINPSDIYMIEGKYPLESADFPIVAGNECLGYYITEKGKFLAIQKRPNIGTWRKELYVEKSDIMVLPKSVKFHPLLSMIVVNPITALRLLKDFGDLKKGDFVIQNASNSVVGKCVIQFAKIYGYKTINIVREREEIQHTISQLKKLGGDVVLTDKEFKSLGDKILSQYNIPRPKLALNAVGGEIVDSMAQILQNGGSVVTYGVMSGEPVTASATLQIFRDIKFVGFWLTHWFRVTPEEEAFRAITEIYGLIESGKLKFDYKKILFDDVDAVMNAIKNPPKDKKAVICME